MTRYFSALPVFSAPSRIDREAGIISGITVAKEGKVRGHDGHIDRNFLIELVLQASTRPQGIKARFGHPNMCATALGTYLGRFRNYSFTGDRVTADLYVDDTAKATPSGNLYDYVFNMAERNPDMFGASIVFENTSFTEGTDEEGNKIKYFQLKELRATDIVDDPAATDGLFSADTIQAQATRLLDENPEIAQLIFNKPESVIEFLHNYLNTTPMSFPDYVIDKFRSLFSLENSSPPIVAEDPEALPAVDSSSSEPTAPAEDLALSIDAAFEVMLKTYPIPALQPQSNGTLFYVSNTPEDSFEVTYERKLTFMLAAIESLNQQYNSTLKLLASMQDENELLMQKLSASPSIPTDVSDPSITVDITSDAPDTTGKQILNELPRDLRNKLRSKSKA